MLHGSGLLLPGIPFPIGVRKTPLVVGGLSFSFVTSGTGDAPTITVPGTPTAGHLCVIWNAAQMVSGDPGQVTPSGFTLVSVALFGVNCRLLIAAKKLVGSETTVTGMNGDSRERWVCATFSPSSPFTSFAAAGGAGSAVSGTPTPITMAISGVTPPVLALGHMYAGGNSVTPRPTSPTMDEIAGFGSAAHYAHYKAYNPGDTPVDQDYTMADNGSTNCQQTVYLTFTV